MCLLARSILRQMSENHSSPVINRAVLSLVFATNQSPPKRARVVYGRSSRARPFLLPQSGKRSATSVPRTQNFAAR